MSSAQYLALKSLETKKRKAHQLAYKTDDKEDKIYNLDPNMTNAGYINAFNVYMHRLRDLEYKTKNPELFTWRQNIKYMNKLKMPQLFVDQEINRRFRKDTTDKKMMRTASEHTLAVQRGTSENGITPRKTFAQSVNKVRNMIKPFSTARRDTDRDENPLRKRGSEPVMASEGVDFSQFDLSTIQRNKRSFSISKLQTSLLSHRTSEVMEVQNIQYMQDQFNRKNTQINKILCQINPKLELLDKQQIQKDTIKKIQDHTKDYKLHQYIVPRDKSLKSLSPQKRSATNVKERPSSASRPGVPTIGLPKDAGTKILAIMKGQDPLNLNLQKSTSKTATEDDKEKEHQNVSQSDKEKAIHISIRNLLDDHKTKKRKAFLVNNEKPKPKSLLKKMHYALDKMDEMLNISTQSRDEQTTTHQQSKSNFLHPRYNMNTERTHKHADRRKSRETPSFDPENLLKNSSSSTPKHSGNRSIANSTDNSPTHVLTDRSPSHIPVDKDNILNYKVYFKQKYQEKGTSLEFSSQLNKKLNAVAKEVGKAIKNTKKL